MNPRLVPLAAILQASDSMFCRALAGMTREQGLARLVGEVNPLLWTAAHVTTTRYGLAQLVGLDHPRPWGTQFTRGSEVGDPEAIPDAEETRAAWEALRAPLSTRLDQLTDPDLDAPSPRKLPVEDASVLGAIAFLAYHEGYHVGQMALVRKALGLGGLVG
ncbi:MAG TPA: DinB family protein [Vicinamibacteria bacterium]|nr:DinB family protein [Vicinamibacteria bacterium]